MKENLPITQREFDYPSNTRIVTTTKPRGALTYANRDFIAVGGYTEEELIGQPHNVVRHPDMPPAVFADLWETIKRGGSWMGVIKNRRKNGDHYWVDGFVTPVMEGREITGYQSVRVRPDRRHVEQAEKVYRQLWNPPGALARWLRWRPALGGQVFLASAATGLAAAAVATLPASAALGLLAGGGVALVGGGLLAQWIALPYRRAAAGTRDIVDNAITRAVYTGRDDELGQLLLAIKYLRNQLGTVVWRIGDASGNLQHSASQTADITVHTERDMQGQKAELELVATAMNEMAATVQEVARNAAQAAEATRTAHHEVNQGQDVVANSANGIRELAGHIEQAVAVIARLAEDTGRIGRVVDVIRSVAEQTNLLALNAAIEAARAGEQGRGFAVVAEEVRSLAQSTQSSTGEIHQLIQNLQQAADEAVSMMEHGQRSAQDSVAQAGLADQSLQSIAGAVLTITEMTTQIATAAEQQSTVSEEINRNILNINTATEQTLESTRASRLANQALVDEVERLQTMVNQFGN